MAVHVTCSGLTFPLGNSVINLATWSFLFHQEKGRLEGVNYFVVIVWGGVGGGIWFHPHCERSTVLEPRSPSLCLP